MRGGRCGVLDIPCVVFAIIGVVRHEKMFGGGFFLCKTTKKRHAFAVLWIDVLLVGCFPYGASNF